MGSGLPKVIKKVETKTRKDPSLLASSSELPSLVLVAASLLAGTRQPSDAELA